MGYLYSPEGDFLYKQHTLDRAAMDLMAATEIMEAGLHEYETTGTPPLGALRYVNTIINKVIKELGLDEVHGREDDVPF